MQTPASPRKNIRNYYNIPHNSCQYPVCYLLFLPQAPSRLSLCDQTSPLWISHLSRTQHRKVKVCPTMNIYRTSCLRTIRAAVMAGDICRDTEGNVISGIPLQCYLVRYLLCPIIGICQAALRKT